MTDRHVQEFLASVRRAMNDLALYPPGHPFTDEAITSLVESADAMTGEAGEAAITLVEDAFYLDRTLLGYVSLEFSGLLRQLQHREIDSITVVRPVQRDDAVDLARYLMGATDEPPAGATLRVNERPLSHEELESSEMERLRSSYAASLDLLRALGVGVAAGEDIALSGVAHAVENLLQQSLLHPTASLLLSTVKSHDEYTYFHSVNTCILSLAMGRLIGLDESQLKVVGLGAILHDLGKVGVPSSVLRHPGRLSPGHWEHIKLHPQEGAESILAASGKDQEIAAAIALEHHARFDGSGYPKSGHGDGHGHERRAGRDLHLFSRLVSVADTYDAVTTRRSYRRAETPNRALRILLNGAGQSYDPDLVRAFIQLMGIYPPGSLLRLESGITVMVIDSRDAAEAGLHVVPVLDVDGAHLAGEEPVLIDGDVVVDQVLVDQAGFDPSSLLDELSPVLASGS